MKEALVDTNGMSNTKKDYGRLTMTLGLQALCLSYLVPLNLNLMSIYIPVFLRFEKDRTDVARALSNIQQNHPGIGVAIKTRHAAQILVHKAEEQVRDLKHRGLIDENEENSFKVVVVVIDDDDDNDDDD